jgi:outer membrane protein assembly factor BamB
LAKSGSWTHQYSDLGNTSCSTDDLVKGPLHALWFRDIDLEIPQRHGRGPAPLYYEGRIFAEGLNELRAVNAYNGRTLWTFALPNVLAQYNQDHLSGTAVTGSNFCVAGPHVYVHDKKNCYKLDAATGEKLAVFPAPPQADGQPGLWGYIACDGETLFGSVARPEVKVRPAWRPADMNELLSESSALFALEPASGKLRWRYDARQSIRHNAIAIGSGRVYLIDRPLAEGDTWDPSAPAKAKLPVIVQAPGRLVAIEIKSGKKVWENEKDIFGTMLAYQAEQDALLMSYQSTRYKLPSEVGGRLAMHRGKTGERVWAKTASYITRPLVNGGRIYAQGGSWDLATGADQPFDFKRSHGCGQLAGSKNLLLYRSATLGYFDLTSSVGSEDFGGVRPGCWINALPVGGLVLLPDAAAGCTCSYQNHSWLGLEGN